MNGFTKTMAVVSMALAMAGCSRVEDTEDSPEAYISGTSLDNDLLNAARGMAGGLVDEKDSLIDLVVASTESEHKVPLEEALSIFRIVPGPRLDSVISLLWVYFPVPEHLDLARKLRDFDVTWQPPYRDDLSIEWIRAYSHEGRVIKLYSSTIPSFPVLMVTFEPTDSVVIVPEPPGEKGQYVPYARNMKIKVSVEPWWLGAMEIYTKTRKGSWPNPYDKEYKQPFWTTDWKNHLYTYYCGEEPLYWWSETADHFVVIWEDDGWGDPDDWVEDFDEPWTQLAPA